MSADNGIYILKSKDGYRVTDAQAIDNIYWHYTCCDNPNVNFYEDNIEYYQKCLNCGTINPDMVKKEEINSQTLKEYFEDSEVFKNEEEAMKKAIELYKEVIDYCGIVEYGIQTIYYDKEFPND